MVGSVYILAVRAFIEDDNGRVLIIKRSENSKTNPSTWELPGGKIGTGESIEEALKREVREETGLEITPSEVMGVVEQKFPIINAVHIIIRCRASGNVKLSHEHEGFAWVEPDGLPRYRLADWLADFLKDIKVERNDEGFSLRDILGFIRRS
ncbi:NUDIX domain-containing protein [Methanothermobacter sp. K4]|uniref:NUDIX hydrolase n=1 Tax=Methanothermobacter sp. K4 TaxID=2913262 RepID=UPI001EDAC819|nr:NUDIX domain-containing protein [Methanothermobacter sp. K4]MCG2829031.1 NUDIX domain-containing protein [Methanothermobacter sp. K4]